MLDSSRQGLQSAALPTCEVADFEAALVRHPPRGIRLHKSLRNSKLPFEVKGIPWYELGKQCVAPESDVIDTNRPSQFLSYATADYYIQDAGSLLSVALADIKPDDAVCDLCAAPGGKASAMLEMLDGRGALLANEPIASRVGLLRYQLSRVGNPRYGITSADPQRLVENWQAQFDVVLVDAPCSGQVLTIKGKRADDAFTTKQIEHSAARQRRILEFAIELLKVDGRLIYSTCTFADAENEGQMMWLQERYPNCFEALPKPELSPWLSALHPSSYRVWPHRDPSAGAFAARLLKVAETAEPIKPAKKSSSKTNAALSKIESASLNFGTTRKLQLFDDAATIRGVAEDSIAGEWLEQGWLRQSNLPTLAIKKGPLWLPTQDAAHLHSDYFQPQQTLEVDEAAAWKILSGQSISLDKLATVGPSKTVLATYQQRGLGWLKFAGNRWNNLLSNFARMDTPKTNATGKSDDRRN